MYRTQGVLPLLALYVGLVDSFSWDVVLANSKQLEFYSNNGTLTHTEAIPTHIISMAYDPVHNRVLFADRNDSHQDHSISSFDIATRKIQSIIRNEQYIYSRIAYDPATQLLFWIDDSSDTINSILIKPGSNDTVYRNLVNFDEGEKAEYIAVDSCGGYIYWTSRIPDSKIERARFDGSEREVVIHRSSDAWLQGIAIDQRGQKIYWFEDGVKSYQPRLIESVRSADLNGENRRTIYTEIMSSSSFDELTVSKDFIYWMTSDAFWQLSKNPLRNRVGKPKKVSGSRSFYRHGIASNYTIEDQNCEALTSLLPINAVPSDYDSLNDSLIASLLCVNGTKVSGEFRCECTHGYIGERCDVSVCHNYCFQGDCSVSVEGQPKCRCNAGYSGERCEVYACHDYCLNNGVCSLNMKSDPVCRCTGYYEGERCEVPTFLVKCFQTVSMLRETLNTDVTPVTLGKGVKLTCAPTAV